MAYPAHKKATDDMASWIEPAHNHTRPHPPLKHRTPNEAEHEPLDHKQAARPTQQPQPEKHPAPQAQLMEVLRVLDVGVVLAVVDPVVQDLLRGDPRKQDRMSTENVVYEPQVEIRIW